MVVISKDLHPFGLYVGQVCLCLEVDEGFLVSKDLDPFDSFHLILPFLRKVYNCNIIFILDCIPLFSRLEDAVLVSIGEKFVLVSLYSD